MSTTSKDTAPAARTSRLLVLVHLACCSAPLLIALGAFGAFGMIGALLADPLVAAGAVALAVLAGVLVVVQRRRSAAGVVCGCALPSHRPASHRPGKLLLAETPAHSGTGTAVPGPTRNSDRGSRTTSGTRF